MAKERVLTVAVRPHTLDGRRGFGITSGRKWNSALYTNEARAQKVCDAIGKSQKTIEVNVAYPAPFMWAKEEETK